MPAFAQVIRHVYCGEAARRRPVGVTLRFLAWQGWRRAVRRPLSFRTVTGTRLRLLPGASDSLSGFWYHQLPDFEELAFALHFIRPGDLFVDVGANQGGWTLTLAGRGARVMAFEPVPATLARLRENVRANAGRVGSRVTVIPLALADKPGEAAFTTDLDAGNRRRHPEEGAAGGSVVVRMARGEDVLADESPALMKIDVEGQELAVLRGCAGLLRKSSLQALIVETFRPHNHGQPSLIAAEGLLREHGFLPCSYDPWKRALSPLVDPSEGGQNTIYVRDCTSVEARARQSEALRAFGTRI